MAAQKESLKIIAKNRKAFHDYHIHETLEAGIELFGSEVKSVRNGNINLKDSWCRISDGQVFAYGIHISPYEKGNIFNKDPLRAKRLLLHKKEIRKLLSAVKQEGFTLIPLSVYFKGPWLKLELGICKGKKLYDKREHTARRDAARNIDRVIKESNRL